MSQYTFGKYCESDRLNHEILNSSISKSVDYVTTSLSETVIHFFEDLTTEEQTTLQDIVVNHEAMSMFRSNYHASSFAVDKDGVDQEIVGNSVTKVTSNRVLWDNDEDYDLEDNIFTPGANGVWNVNGTIAVTPSVTCTRIDLHLYRNDEIYFTVASVSTSITSKCFITFSCDFDAYVTSGHYFDLRIELHGLLPTATISGSDEETAWGASFIVSLSGESPT